MEKFKTKIIGMKAKKMFDILRSSGKIGFANDVIGLKTTKIVDGLTGKYILPDGDYGYISLDERGAYLKAYLNDGSDYIVSLDEESNSLIFDFNTSANQLAGMRETILSFMDYDYEKV